MRRIGRVGRLKRSSAERLVAKLMNERRAELDVAVDVSYPNLTRAVEQGITSDARPVRSQEHRASVKDDDFPAATR
jgi:hypothetical protein